MSLFERREKIAVYTDGATVGYNGRLGTVTTIKVGFHVPSLGIESSTTEPGISNNVAEYRAVVRALESLHEHHEREILIFSDSRLIVNFVNGKVFTRNKPHLYVEQVDVYNLLQKFKRVSAKWIPREKNRHADALSKKG